MSRTTPALVAGIIDVQAGVDLTPFVVTANQLVTQLCSASGYADGPDANDGTGSLMGLIERWLAAHFYAIFDGQLTTAKAGTAEVRFQHKIDLGLKVTHWGQQAMILDTAGGLAAWNNTAATKRRITVDISWLGRRRRGLGDVDGDQFADLTVEQ